MRVMINHLVSPSYFTATAAVELGFFEAEGIDAVEAEIIAELIERDAPFYDANISEDTIVRLNRFAQDAGLLSGPVAYEHVVATEFAHLWNE